MLSNGSEFAKAMNEFFSFTVTNLVIKRHTESTTTDPVNDIIHNSKS